MEMRRQAAFDACNEFSTQWERCDQQADCERAGSIHKNVQPEGLTTTQWVRHSFLSSSAHWIDLKLIVATALNYCVHHKLLHENISWCRVNLELSSAILLWYSWLKILCVFGGWDGTPQTYKDSVPGYVIIIMYNMVCNVDDYYHDCDLSFNRPSKDLTALHATLAVQPPFLSLWPFPLR